MVALATLQCLKSKQSYKTLTTQFEEKLQDGKELTLFQMLQLIQSYWQNHDTHFKEANQADKEANNVKRKIANNASQEVPKKQRTGNTNKCTFCDKTGHTADMCFQTIKGNTYRKPGVKQTHNQNTKQKSSLHKMQQKRSSSQRLLQQACKVKSYGQKWGNLHKMLQTKPRSKSLLCCSLLKMWISL